MDFLTGITSPNIPLFGLGGVLKLLFLILVIGYLIYVFLMTLRVRILGDTVKTKNQGMAKLVAYIHLLFAVIGSLLATILILVG